jgi:hypothetical protein
MGIAAHPEDITGIAGVGEPQAGIDEEGIEVEVAGAGAGPAVLDIAEVDSDSGAVVVPYFAAAVPEDGIADGDITGPIEVFIITDQGAAPEGGVGMEGTRGYFQEAITPIIDPPAVFLGPVGREEGIGNDDVTINFIKDGGAFIGAVAAEGTGVEGRKALEIVYAAAKGKRPVLLKGTEF